MVTSGDGMRLIRRVELEDWVRRARMTWNPIMAAERQFNALTGENEDVPGLASYDDLYDMANLAVQWLEDNRCPDAAVGRRFKAKMMAYRAVADTVRSTITEEDGDAMVAQLGHLRNLVDHHADAIDEEALLGTHLVPRSAGLNEGSASQYRRRVPRQPAGWNGICSVEGDNPAGWRECRVIDISMFGLAIMFDHPSPSLLVGRRIAIDVPAIGDSVSIRLEGEVKNAGPTPLGAIRVGVEFDGFEEREPGTTHHRLEHYE
jgi:hypothetical protein